MKKLIFSAASIMLTFAVDSFAGDNKSIKEAKSPNEAPVEVKTTSTTYYAIRIGNTNNFTWTSNPNDLIGLQCVSLPNASCSVSANSKPGDNTNPDTTPDHKAYQQPPE